MYCTGHFPGLPEVDPDSASILLDIFKPRLLFNGVLSMAQDEDTDTKLALLASLLEPNVFEASRYLDALSSAHGDVSVAAENLLLNGSSIPKKRSQVSGGLAAWLGQSSKKNKATAIVEEIKEVPIERKSAKSILPVADLSMLLKDTGSKGLNERPKQAALPPVILATPEQIASTVPCTLHASPLPAPLASAIYLTLMNVSDSWEKRSWYMAGRKVEAPHATCFYVRKGEGYGAPEGSKEKARYFYAAKENDDPPVRKEYVRHQRGY